MMPGYIPHPREMLVETTEMHTAGGAIRIVESGFPVPQGVTVMDKMENLRKNHDDFRRMIMSGPRGHNDLFGILKVTPDHPDADIGIIFFHNRNYSTMCGHGIIALGRYAVDKGLTKRQVTIPEMAVHIQCPCGLVTAYVRTDPESNAAGCVRYHSVPSFVVNTDVDLHVPGLGKFCVDVAFGGAFYAFVAANDVGVVSGKSTIEEIGRLGNIIRDAAVNRVPVYHPHTKAFICGVMFVDSRTSNKGPATTICTFSDAEVDRSPCGSGTSARVALMYHRGLLSLGQEQVFTSGVTGERFTAKAVKEAGDVDGRPAIITEVSGKGYYMGTSYLVLEKDDILRKGYLIA